MEPATVDSKVIRDTNRTRAKAKNKPATSYETTENRSDDTEIFYECQQEVWNNNNLSSDEQSSNTVPRDDSKKYTSSS